jgi:hypothetical protein
MEPTPAAPEGTDPERSKEPPDPRRDPLRYLLDATTRLHLAQDLESERGLAQAVAEIVRELFGPTQGFVLVKTGDGDLRLHLDARRVEAQDGPVPPVLAKALESAHPVIEGQGQERRLALRLRLGSQVVGGLYLATAEAERRFGPQHLDLITHLARHLGLAAGRLAAAGSGGGPDGEAELPGLLKMASLSQAKRAFERLLILARLRQSKGNIAGAARALDMDRGQLSRLLRKHQVDKGRFRAGQAP